MLREYDFTIITKGDLVESEHHKVLQGYENLMTIKGGEILKRDDWGSKRLAYPIGKSFRGNYVNYDFVGAPDSVAEMERLMRIDDNVLRYLVVRMDEESDGAIDVSARKAELAKQDREAKEAEMKRRKE
ncbi:30S ribosomal protein S6 [Planctomyces bekefii]|uniref:Small ribosomal subunit protein bS6 n=1 Tax=Planctomyces bekefii TaxID=1653850 RepID=A0A5C6M642_9PLAN|nr:30S ribosomal protein S6 [Planctomyces bekefii]